VRARKRFGQHFLHDPAVIERIVRAVGPHPSDHLVEIGPGRGALTRALLASDAASLDAIEIDRDLAALLASELAGEARFALHAADALSFDYAGLAARHRARLRIVGNLPYNISTPLLFRLLASAPAIEDMHVMLQREVVERISAPPGGGDYGRLTVMLAPRVATQHLFDIGPGAFRPAPKVWSAVVRLTVRPVPLFTPAERFAEVVAAAFAQRRKTLRNSLKGLLSAAQIASCGIDPGARAQVLSPEDFNRLAQAAAASPRGPGIG